MPSTVTAAQLFAEVGEAAFGPRWQSSMSRRLGLNLRTVERIAEAVRDGKDYQIAPGVMADLQEICREKAAEAEALIPRLARFAR